MKIRLSTLVLWMVALSALVIVFHPPAWDGLRASSWYWKLSSQVGMPLLQRLEPEKAHDVTIKLLKNHWAPVAAGSDSDQDKHAAVLKTTVFGLTFDNPLGVAAGFDKQAEAMEGLLQLGFGFVEVGGVTPEPQAGNPKPRLFRLTEDKAVINRYGLNSQGHPLIAARLKKFRETKGQAGARTPNIIGVNIAKNTTSDDMIGDYKKGVEQLGGHVDFIVLNVSCPNVAWTKNLNQKGDEMLQMVQTIKTAREQLSHKPALLLKLGPDMNESTQQRMAALALESGIDGLIVSNTTSERPDTLKSRHRQETGGLSGRPVKAMALQTLRDMRRLTQGKIPIIAVGGIESGQDAYERIRAGASLVQIYTALVYEGPAIVPRIKHELAELLRRDGFSSVAEAVGAVDPVFSKSAVNLLE